MAKDKVETTIIRVSLHAKSMADKIHKIVAVESNGEIMTKTESLEVALGEFLDNRAGKKGWGV